MLWPLCRLFSYPPAGTGAFLLNQPLNYDRADSNHFARTIFVVFDVIVLCRKHIDVILRRS